MVRLWDTTTGALLNTLESHTDRVSSVNFSPDSTRLVSGSRDRTIRVWDSATGLLLATIDKDGELDEIQCVSFSPDGTRIVPDSTTPLVQLW